MAKQVDRPVALAEFEIMAEEFIGLTLDRCEEELRLERFHHSRPPRPRRKALAAAALSVQESINAFLAVVKIERQ